MKTKLSSRGICNEFLLKIFNLRFIGPFLLQCCHCFPPLLPVADGGGDMFTLAMRHYAMRRAAIGSLLECLTHYHTTNFEWSKLKQSADDNFKFDENTRKFSERVENAVGKGEIARYEQFLLFLQCLQKACFPGASKGVIVWEWVKETIYWFLYGCRTIILYSLKGKLNYICRKRKKQLSYNISALPHHYVCIGLFCNLPLLKVE